MATAMTGTTDRLVKTGAIEGFSGKYVKLYVAYKSSQDAANNQSTVSVGMYVVPDLEIGRWGDWSGSYVGNSTLTFDGTVPAGTTSKYWLVSNKTFTVNHKTDGTGSATIYWKWGVNSSWGGMVNPSGSFTITLPTIPRASSISAANAYIRDNVKITISKASSTFKHTLQYKLTGQSSYTTLVSKTTASTYDFNTANIATTALNLLASNSKYLNCAINCITYNSAGTKIGEKAITIKLTGKDADLKPTLNPTIEDSDDAVIKITGNNKVILKYYSKPLVYFFPSSNYNNEITSYKVVNGSKTLKKDGAVFSDGVESNVFTFTITDTRGYTVSQEVKLSTSASRLEFVNAVKPTATLTTGNPILSADGKTFGFDFTVKGSCFCGSLGSKNAESRIYYRYKETGSSTWLGSTVSSGWIEIGDSVGTTEAELAGFNSDKTSYNFSSTLSGLDYTKSYTIQGRIFNTIQAVDTDTQQKKASPVFEWDDEEFQFNVPVKFPNSSFKSKNQGINMNNGDVWGLNGIWFADMCSSGGEGIYLPHDDSSGNYDLITAYNGQLYFRPNYPTNTTYYKVFYTPGDTITLANNCAIHGFISNARKSILLTIPLNKPLIGVSGATLKGTLQMRGVGGYIYNQASNKTEKTTTFATAASSHTAEGITSTGQTITGQSLMISFTFSAALTHNAAGTTATTNNTPIIVVPDGNFTITFT